jgi:hypothetical protein
MDKPTESMREQARAMAARSMEAMRRAQREGLDEYARLLRDTPHWLDAALEELQNTPAEPWARYPVVFRLPDPDGRILCHACFYDQFDGTPIIERLPAPTRRFRILIEDLFETHCLALGPGAFKLLFGKSLICNLCERVVTPQDVHVCATEEAILAHVAWVLRDPTGIIPVRLMESLTEPLFASAVSDGLFSECRWHRYHFTIRP